MMVMRVSEVLAHSVNRGGTRLKEIDFNHTPSMRCRVILHHARDGVLCIALQCFIVV